jgi:hypothetical protein
MMPMPSAPTSEPSANSPATASAWRTHGVTARSLLIGALLVPTLCVWTLYTEIVAQSTELAVMSLSVGVVFAILALLLLNGLLKRTLPRLALSRAELLFIYVMQTTSIAISGVGMMQFLNIGLANIFWFATPENNWKQSYQPLLRRWAFPDPAALRAYYLGDSSFFTRTHLLAWLAPILVWTVFLMLLLGVMLCLNVILRRRWVEQERLTFPLAVLPLELVRQDNSRAFFTHRGLWGGFLLAFALETMAGLAYLYPSLPFFPIKPSDPRLMATPFSSPPWNAIGEVDFAFYPMAIGLTYLLPQDVSFSCWFFFLLRRLEDVGATALGFRDPGASMAVARIPYSGEQAGGAFLALALFSLWTMRGYLKSVLLTAWRPDQAPLDDRNEPLTYRQALLGALAGFAALVVYAMLLGMSAWIALLFFALYFLVVITYTRLRAEAGLPWAFGPDMTPHQMITAAAGTQALSLNDMVALTQFQWLDLDYRCTIMPHQLEAMKIGSEARLNQRHLLRAVLLAMLIGVLASWVGVLAVYYHYGAATARVDGWRTSMGSTPWSLLDGWVNQPTKRDWPSLEGVAVGVVVTGLLVAGRTRFGWWPFHPVGYALAGTFTMPWLWCPTLLGWLLKTGITRYGGMRVHRQVLPFFIGLILGDYVAGALWALFGCATGAPTYKVMPI